MKIFISWSGTRSHRVAQLLKEWLKCVIQAVDPWLSSSDIGKGSTWFNELSKTLSNVKIGIICLTKENRDRPWILFESGALAKGLDENRVMTFLIDLQPLDIQGPLTQFNHTMPNKESVRGLILSINKELGDIALNDGILNTVFDTYWPQFETKFQEILATTHEDEKSVKRNTDDILSEILTLARSTDKTTGNILGRVRWMDMTNRRNAPLTRNERVHQFINDRNSLFNFTDVKPEEEIDLWTEFGHNLRESGSFNEDSHDDTNK